MPCSCGMTFCPCGIPCYCVAESCKCQDCAIALPRFCKLCNKPLISHRKTDEDTCSCFLREPSALILENRDIPMRRMGNIPMSINPFVTGKVTVNFTTPIPTLTSPPLISQRPFCFMPPLSVEESQINLSTSYEDALKPPSPSEDYNSTAEIYQFPRKFSRQFSDYNSSGYSSSSEQNTEIPRQKIYTPPGILHSTRESQIVNVEQKTGTEICANIGEKTSFYLPSVIIGNISYPVRLEDPVWRLPNPAIVVEPESTLNIGNPFYEGGPINAIQNNEYNRSSTFEVDEIQCFPETEVENILEESGWPFQMNDHVLDPITISENLVTDEEYIDITSPYNNAIASSYNSVVPYSSNAIAEHFATSTSQTLTANSMNRIIERLCPVWMSRSQENSLFPFRNRRNRVGQEATVKQTSKLKTTLYLDNRTIEKMEKYLNFKIDS